MKTHIIAGKDRIPAETVHDIQSTLNDEGYFPEILSEYVNGGTVSILISHEHSNRFIANGKGVSRELTLASAYGEFMERYLTRFYFYDLWLTKDGPLPCLYDENEIWTSNPGPVLNSLKKVYPDKILHKKYSYDINRSSDGSSYCFLPYKTSNNDRIYIPVTFWREFYTSNGLAYGNNIYEARVQALCEIIERHVKYRVIGEGLSLPEIPVSELKNPDLFQDVKKLFARHKLECRLLDASLGKGYPVTALLVFSADKAEAFLSFGAHPDKEIAIERTITETFQGRNIETDMPDFLMTVSDDRSLTGLAENLESHFINSTGFLHANIFKPVSNDFTSFQTFDGTSEDEWNYLCRLIESDGYLILSRDVIRNGHTACQIIIPGFSEVYPFSDILEKDNKMFCIVRNKIWSLLDKDPIVTDRLIELLESDYFRPDQDLGDALGILFPPKSPWYGRSVGSIVSRQWTVGSPVAGSQ